LHLRVLEALSRIAGYRVPAPVQFARFGIIGTNKTTYTKLCTTVANEDLPFGNTGSASTGVRPLFVDITQGIGNPDLFATGCIQRDQAAIVGAQINFIAPGGDAAVNNITAADTTECAGHFRVVMPERLT